MWSRPVALRAPSRAPAPAQTRPTVPTPRMDQRTGGEPRPQHCFGLASLEQKFSVEVSWAVTQWPNFRLFSQASKGQRERERWGIIRGNFVWLGLITLPWRGFLSKINWSQGFFEWGKRGELGFHLFWRNLNFHYIPASLDKVYLLSLKIEMFIEIFIYITVSLKYTYESRK